MTDLNERGLRDGLAALADIRKIIAAAMQDAQHRHAKAEVEMMAQQKLFGFVEQQIHDFRYRLAVFEAAKDH